MLRSRTVSLLATALIAAPPGVLANPLGGQVAGGQATIQGQGTATVTVTQGSQNAIINWYTFNIGAGEKTQFIQPNAGAVALNRVTGGQGPSTIYGNLTANGRVFLINPDGIMVGPGGVVNAAGFLASTNDIKNSDFMAGNYKFTIPGKPDASVVNLGNITAANGGFAALVAPGVRNAGVITANLGSVALASGNGFTLDFYGDKLITLQVGDAIANKVIDVATGQTLDALVKNEGVLRANGGQVALTAVAARHVVDSVINNKGVIEANSIGTKNGMIVLGAATASTKGAGAPKQTVKVSGTLSVAGQKKGQKGGVIQITGEDIQVAGAKLDASGQAGGGTVLIGGDTGGGTVNPAVSGLSLAQLQSWSVPTASTVSIDASTVIDASAKSIGNGGKVVVWSNQATNFNGTILASGAGGGIGGFVETSGHSLQVTGSVNAGAGGTWLLDPDDLLINASLANSINATLNGGANVTETTSAPTNGGFGNITVNAPITWSTNASLTLDAYNAININAPITVTGGGALHLTSAINPATSLPMLSFANGANVQFTSVNQNGSLVINNQGYVLLYSMQDVQNINTSSLNGHYALAKPLDATGVSGWTPIGTGAVGQVLNKGSGFVGMFQGLGNTISNLTINSTAQYTGLFGYIGVGGVVQDFGLTNVHLTATQHDFNGWVGALAGWSAGQITQSYATGSVSGGVSYDIGGLVGRNTGAITKSYADVATSGGNFSAIGGLVGNNIGSVSQSFALGSVNAGSGSFGGGLVGWNSTGTIDQSYAAGAVSAPGTAIGGLVGFNGGIVTSSYWDTQVTTQTAGFGTNKGTFDGTGLTTAQSLQQSSYVGWDFGPNGVWSIVDGQTRPSFQVQLPPQPPQPPPPNTTTDTGLAFVLMPPLNQQVAPPPPNTNNNTPILINLTTGGPAPSGAGGNDGNGNGGAKPNYGPPPGPGLGRTLDEQQYSGVPPPNETRFRAGEAVIQVVDTVPVEQVVQVAQGLGMVLVSSEHLDQTHRILYHFRATGAANVRALILAFEKNQLIASAEPNYVVLTAQAAPAAGGPAAPATPATRTGPAASPAKPDQTNSVPPPNEASPDLANSDTAALLSLPAGDAAQYVIEKLHLGAVHRLASGRNVTIAVVDSEIDGAHPDLRGVIVERFDATKSPSRPHPHGTGMAGAIASHARLLGVAPGARILAIKAFDDSGSSAESTTFQIIKALDYAITKNVRIINMSFAGPRDPMMERTLKAANDKGIILIAAAGNAGPKSPPLYPGADPSVIAVSATDYDDKPFAMANRGKYIAVAAPGVDVMVPAPGGGYQLTTGTSVAAAHVSGVAALLLERNPTMKPAELRALLMKTATAFSAKPKGEEDGAGLVDPVGALKALTPPKTSEVLPSQNGPSASVH